MSALTNIRWYIQHRTIRQSAEVVNQMVCVERVTEYSKLDAEASLSCEADSAPWPESGSIEVKNLSIRYRDSLPLTLKGVSFHVPSGKRVGVVGRTGSGKSKCWGFSCFACMFNDSQFSSYND